MQQVVDNANNNASTLGDFKYDAATKTTTDYGYDGNGNLTSDANKKISSIAYNHLNLPQTINVDGKGTISYKYDAAGNKLQKIVTEGSNTKTTTYIGGIVYENDALQFIANTEGRIRPNASNSGFVFDYYLKDHLGNTRMTITDDAAVASHILDATSYYPFGLAMQGISYKASGSLTNKYKYNGKELQSSEFSDGSGLEAYDYGARVYDEYGRWWQPDPLAEKFYSLSPYGFCSNNPIMYVDPNGEEYTIHYYARDENNVAIKKDGQYVMNTLELKNDKDLQNFLKNPGDNFYLNAVATAFSALTENGADGGVVDKLLNLTENINITEVSGKNDYGGTYGKDNKKEGEVNWNPLSGEVFQSGKDTKIMAPVLGLLHELGHAYFDFFEHGYPRNYSEFKDPKKAGYSYEDDHRIVEKFEKPAAKALNLPTRNNYFDATRIKIDYMRSGALSTTPAPGVNPASVLKEYKDKTQKGKQ